MARYKIEKLPLVDDEFHLKGLITLKDIEKTRQYPNASKDDKGRLLAGACGGWPGHNGQGKALVDAGVDVIVIDAPTATQRACWTPWKNQSSLP